MLVRVRRWLRAAVRSVMLVGMFVEAGLQLLWTRPVSRAERAAWLHRFCKRSLRRMGIPVTVHGDFPERGFLIVNHRSYLDIVVLASVRPCVFVSKAEVARLPVIGWMTTRSGTVYVERGRGGSAKQASEAMRLVAADGLPVVFFPEGTTNTAEELLPFRSGLLSQALESGEVITAGYLRYSMGPDNGADVSLEENLYWGDLPMMQHVFTFLGLKGVVAEARFSAAPIVFSAEGLHRKSAAIEARVALVTLQTL